jgi:hypothetical protein
MVVSPYVEISEIFGGVAARASELGLTGHGRDDAHALASLERGVVAWCHGLAADGSLEDVLTRQGVEWRQEGEGISLEMRLR